MSAGAASADPIVTIAGNPNGGKTSIFNRLTGGNLKIGNYPGVTVERHEATVRLSPAQRAVICDVPGTYSLSARSAEEQIAIVALTGIPPVTPPDLTVLVLDATQLARSLYLVLQVIEAGGKIVVALNMVDMLESRGLRLDHERLADLLGVPVVPVNGLTGAGIPALRHEIESLLAISSTSQTPPGLAIARDRWRWAPTEPALVEDIEAVAVHLPVGWMNGGRVRPWALAMWCLLSVDEHDELHYIPPALRETVAARREQAKRAGRDLDRELIETRFDWIDRHLDEIVVNVTEKHTRTERIDAVLLHPVMGFALFLLIMGVVFQSLFSWSDPAIRVVEYGINVLAQGAESVLPGGILRDFLVEGVIAGVGSVVAFLPQILLLFFFIGLMEDTGYMARVAFLMDRVMRHLGLHGRAFVPMLSGFACAVPAILATRTMERQRDRTLTMMVIPLMTCSARLPVYTLIIAALFPPVRVLSFFPVQGLLMMAMYLFSTLIALAAAAVLSRTLFKGPSVPLILELPPYRRPHLRSVMRMMWSRSSLFLREAGSVILICTICLWLLLSFPRNPELPTDYAGLRAAAAADASGTELETRLDTIQDQERGAILAHSYGARLGKGLEPALRPLGFDWKIGVGIIGAFAAREVFISTLGVVYGVGGDVDDGSATMREQIRNQTRDDGRRVYTPLVGLSLMVFFALACQCMSTLAAVRRETHSWVWPGFLLVYMTVLAWVFSFAVYQGGKLLGFE